MAEIIFERTCNYLIDAGIVGFYDTLGKPVPGSGGIGQWAKTIRTGASITVRLNEDALIVTGEDESALDKALGHAIEWIRCAIYDVSTEKQVAKPESDGRVKRKSTTAGEIIATGKQAEGYTYFNKELIEKAGMSDVFLPLKKVSSQGTCVFCGCELTEKLKLPEINKLFSGTTEKSSPFVEGVNSNLAFHSAHKPSQKCWRCGYAAFFAPLLVFYRRHGKDVYYALPHVPGNLKATYTLHRSLSGKRGLARVLGSDHSTINYESSFIKPPAGLSAFTLTFYHDLASRLLPKSGRNLLSVAQNAGLVDDRGVVFQSAFFLKRASGQQKTFILRESTIDRSAYFIKLFAYLQMEMDSEGHHESENALKALLSRTAGDRSHLQRASGLGAAQAITEGRHIYRFLLPVLSSDLTEETARPYEAKQITTLFQIYDCWLFRKETTMSKDDKANLVKDAKKAGWDLSQEFWRKPRLDEEEKRSLIKRYYFTIERAPSPVRFLEQSRHACQAANICVPKNMEFHDGNGKDDLHKFEVYRVYFLAGMLNGLLNPAKDRGQLAVPPSNEPEKQQEEQP